MNGLPSFRRILLIRRKALGDSLVTIPAVLEVIRAWPAASIDLVMDRPFAPLMEELVGRDAAARADLRDRLRGGAEGIAGFKTGGGGI